MNTSAGVFSAVCCVLTDGAGELFVCVVRAGELSRFLAGDGSLGKFISSAISMAGISSSGETNLVLQPWGRGEVFLPCSAVLSSSSPSWPTPVSSVCFASSGEYWMSAFLLGGGRCCNVGASSVSSICSTLHLFAVLLMTCSSAEFS